MIAFNGELYGGLFKSQEIAEVDYIYSLYRRFGADLGRHLEGEFSIVVVDITRQLIHLIRDYFGTKPLFAENNGTRLRVSSVAGDLDDPTLIPANRALSMSLSTLELVSERRLVDPLVVKPGISENWEKEFRRTMALMWPLEAASFVPLSSGHDSGLIAITLASLGYSPTYYILPRGENLDVLNRRIIELEKMGKKVVIIDLESDEEQKAWRYLNSKCDSYRFRDEKFHRIDPIRSDPASIGVASIYKHATENGLRVCFSGQGGDEIYSGGYSTIGPRVNVSAYMNEDHGKQPKDRFPWRHLKNGRMTRYLLKEEMLATSFSIEGRYPLLAMRPFMCIYKITMTPTVSISRDPLRCY